MSNEWTGSDKFNDDPIIEAALLDMYAALSVQIADLKLILSDPENARAEAQRAAERQLETAQANQRTRDRIAEMETVLAQLQEQVRRL